jgi:hypothetical protein
VGELSVERGALLERPLLLGLAAEQGLRENREKFLDLRPWEHILGEYEAAMEKLLTQRRYLSHRGDPDHARGSLPMIPQTAARKGLPPKALRANELTTTNDQSMA